MNNDELSEKVMDVSARLELLVREAQKMEHIQNDRNMMMFLGGMLAVVIAFLFGMAI